MTESTDGQRRGIIAAGNFIIDHVKIIDRLPEEDHLATIEEETLGTGGAAYNAAVGIKALDPATPVEAVGTVGDDDDGRFILDHLARLGVDTAQMRATAKAPTSYTDVMTVRATGRRTFFHNHGANALLDAADFDFTRLRGRIMHLGYLMLLRTLDSPDPASPGRTRAADVLERARAAGIQTAVDVVTRLDPQLRETVAPALAHTDHFIANEVESGAIAGIAARDDSGRLNQDSLRHISDALFRLGVRRHVVIHAPEGGWWQDADGTHVFCPSLAVPREFIKGAAGAGDAFATGILHGLHEGWEPFRTLNLAAANAAMSLGDSTTTGGLRPLDEVLALIARFGFRDA